MMNSPKAYTSRLFLTLRADIYDHTSDTSMELDWKRRWEKGKRGKSLEEAFRHAPESVCWCFEGCTMPAQLDSRKSFAASFNEVRMLFARWNLITEQRTLDRNRIKPSARLGNEFHMKSPASTSAIKAARGRSRSMHDSTRDLMTHSKISFGKLNSNSCPLFGGFCELWCDGKLKARLR